MAALPLVDRPDGATLFLRPSGPVTKAAFLGDVARVASGLPEGGHVVNLCRDRYAFAVTFAASVRQASVCLLPGEATTAVLTALGRDYPGCVAAADEAINAPFPTVVVRPEGASGSGENPLVPGERLAAIVFTSGSTGVPTAHRKSWAGLVARSRSAGERFGLEEARPPSVVGTVPPGHMYGFETTVLLPLHAACASWCGPSFFPADVQAALEAVPATRILVTTPLQLRALRGVPAEGLAAAISATAPLDPALAAEAEAQWNMPMLEIFGATECGSIASRRTVAGPGWSPYPGVRLRLEDDGAVVEAEGMAPVPLADEIEIAEDGSFVLLGRRADMVKLGGRRASLAGLNRILTGLPGVRDGIFVVPDDLDRRSTARLLALVVAPDRSGPSILADLRDRMDPVFVPRRVVHVDKLPRNALGKLPRQAVLELLARAEGR